MSLNASDVVYQDAGAFVAGPTPLARVADTGNPPIEPGTSFYIRAYYRRGAQTAWLRRTLAEARRDDSIDWIICQMHQDAPAPTATAGVYAGAGEIGPAPAPLTAAPPCAVG